MIGTLISLSQKQHERKTLLSYLNCTLIMFFQACKSNDDEMWKSFADKLLQLRDLTLIGHKWSESEALIRAVGSRLNRIYLALRSLQSWDGTEVTSVPKLDQLLDLCPNLEYLTASFGPLAVNVSNHIELQHLR